MNAIDEINRKGLMDEVFPFLKPTITFVFHLYLLIGLIKGLITIKFSLY